MKKTPLVGIFDSGIGGLTVLKECAALLPDCRFVYYGDHKHVPYGSRTAEEIRSFTERAFELFLRMGTDAAVIACNTATAVAAERLRKRFPFPVVGMEPAVKLAAESCQRALVLVTPVTANSRRLRGLMLRFPQCRFRVHSAPDLAAAIERSVLSDSPLSLAEHLPSGEFDGVVLGCTHYVFVREEIERFYGCKTFDGNYGTAQRLKKCLKTAKIGTDDHSEPLATTWNKGANTAQKRVIFVNSIQNPNKCVYSEQMFLKKLKIL